MEGDELRILSPFHARSDNPHLACSTPNDPSSPSPSHRKPPAAAPPHPTSPAHSAGSRSGDDAAALPLSLQQNLACCPRSPRRPGFAEPAAEVPSLQPPQQAVLCHSPHQNRPSSPASEGGCGAMAASPRGLPPPHAQAAVPVAVVGLWRRGGATLGMLRRIATDPQLQLLSLWWAAVYGPVLIFAESYITNVYQEVDASQEYNGHVDAVAALARIAGALCAPLLQPLAARRPGVAHGLWLAAAAVCVAAVAGSASLMAAYVWYTAAVALLQLQLCVVQAESAAAVAGAEYTALFGLNQLATLLLQGVFQVCCRSLERACPCVCMMLDVWRKGTPSECMAASCVRHRLGICAFVGCARGDWRCLHYVYTVLPWMASSLRESCRRACKPVA